MGLLDDYVSRRLASPSGLIGRHVLPRLWNLHNGPLNDHAFSELPPGDSDRLLEIGFGGGYLLERLLLAARCTVAGVDPSRQMVEFCSHRLGRFIDLGRLDLRCASGDDLPFEACSFEKIYSVNSLPWWTAPERILAEAARVLVRHGWLVLVFAHARSLERRSFARSGAVTLHDERSAGRLAEGAGLHVVRSDLVRAGGRDVAAILARKPLDAR